MSTRFRSILEANGLTGWQAIPVVLEVHGLADNREYSLLVVSGKTGPIDNLRSHRVILPPHTSGGKSSEGWRGLFFAAGTWDRSDFFVPQGTGYVCTTDRARMAVTKAGATNCLFEPLDQVETAHALAAILVTAVPPCP